MKKSILIAVYDMEIGGIERSLINMLESFNYDNYEVDLLIFNHTGDFLKLIPGQVNILPQVAQYSIFRKSIYQCVQEGHVSLALVRVLSKFMGNFKATFRRLEEDSGYMQMQLALKYASAFLPRVKKEYDVVISYAWPHDILAKKVKAHKKIAWIHTDYSKLEIDNKIDYRIWDRFDYIASVSQECTNSFLKMYPDLKKRIVLIENITSPEFIKKRAFDTVVFSNPENSFRILSVGRLSYVKGFDLAVKSLKILYDRGFTNIKWYVIGYGGYENELEELISQHNMQNSFILLGKKTNPYPYMKLCDIYVQPSRYEGKAVTVTEAKILGKPVLITNYPTAKSQINDGVDGFICKLSPEDLANSIESLYLDEDKRKSVVSNIKQVDYSNSEELEKLYAIIK
ncbi:glycosyltransferase [Peribacillus kribbensis]|uniref:glycosyltransferase n=1 Tax=Peribacillus kribbensis TaxID=356658 RepID=UPI0004014CD0|nr:glycosyltransferase [Peribacillus kribbensis]